ncbi:MAG: hypothetical protein KJ558_04605 [Gammaproteobacteria bacterium]|nr:hypothetical protein [Gammaproteobacteria bacterium]MBU1654101.1 hypothetical protein [Gammaproteobacteria bacterium]MBU1961682.1 hypothetical protein [Gammaproteobacteria bacterium]
MRWTTAFDALGYEAASRIAAAQGTPFIVIDERSLWERWEDLSNALAGSRLFLPYKSCPLSALRAYFHRKGMGAEVASHVELQAALTQGVMGSNILLNQPLRDVEAFRLAMKVGAILVADGLEDVETILREASNIDQIRMLLRINPLGGQGAAWTRFGVSLDDEALEAILYRVRNEPKLEMIGVHCHLGTNLIDASLYTSAVSCLAERWAELEQRCGNTLRVMDLGGGFPTPSSCPTYHHRTQWRPLSPAEIMNSVRDILDRNQLSSRVETWFEPGRVLLEEAGVLVSRVLDVRNSPLGALVTCDSGTNHVPTAAHIRHPISHLINPSNYPGQDNECILYGALCMQSDVLSSSCIFPADIKPGDLIKMGAVGAYDIAFSFPFIQGRCPVLMQKMDGSVEMIRRREGVGDFAALEWGP